MSSLLETAPKVFVDEVFRPMIAYVYQDPMETTLPDELKEVVCATDANRRRSLGRIAMEELLHAASFLARDEERLVDAIAAYWDICSVATDDMSWFIDHVLDMKLAKKSKRQLLQCIAESDASDDARRDFFVIMMQSDSLSDTREQALKHLATMDLVHASAIHALAHQLRDKSKRVQRLAFITLLSIAPEMVVGHLESMLMTQTMGLLCVLGQDLASKGDHELLARLLVVYCTWPQHTMQATCSKLLALDAYPSLLLQSLVRDHIQRLVKPND
ncbi:hypothetical protein SPRG_02425 [Saprolegnia parasitica CBS 223.65]|uniref:Uncharacterized protein n=1 Tax=Saprolegnia parasitica (strain CBS 223.65) TaxID=695850 RepID=A0A067D129_SAPPC|nr:hypothetical protein SPRG_02425 [Saprolegnia parasitica CBS 223.65]KDO32727.1 hypothetical protein SPRG_02425 [Saprolegnia parasitica CBS 223.65]|eukprot:XP_012196391.1 hypothetical protein SPRG_02425 [Saprolegnia parasitica CBS 223.65]